jgi:serine/threonine protein kinase
MSDANSQAQGIISPVNLVALKPGQIIGRYEVVSVLGQGGFGITYRAHDSQLGREVAIKEYLPAALAVRQDGTTVLPRSTAVVDDFAWGRERFVAEGRTLASLQNAPAIVRVFDFLEANGTAYIVMQLVEGETLKGCLKRSGPLKPSNVDRIIWPLLDGLEQVHNAGFLHRDIKPANILLDAAGNPTLIDFGASRAAIAGRSTVLTAIFTPGYAAPEQMASAKQGPWTDIYGLSATLYHAITGKIPPNAVNRMLNDAYEPLGHLNLPGFPPGLLAGIDTGFAARATDRPQTIAGWRAILGQTAAPAAEATIAIGRAPAVAASPQALPPVQAASPAKNKTARRMAVAATVLLAGAGAVYGLMVANKALPPQVAATPSPVEQAAQDSQTATEGQHRNDQQELEKLGAAAAAREKAEQEAAQCKQIEEESRRRIEAEMAEKQRLQDEARQKAEAEAAQIPRRANRPEIRVGEAWVLQSRNVSTGEKVEIRLRAVSIDGDRIVAEVADGLGMRIFTRDWNLVEEKTGTNDQTAKPFWPFLRFPLEVGQKWETPFEVETTNSAFRRIATWNWKAQVTAAERVTVPAGTFGAFRIEYEGTFHQENLSARRGTRSFSGIHKETAWYAPAAGRIVKREVQQSSPPNNFFEQHVVELLSFVPAK